jgi:hypothetical protein
MYINMGVTLGLSLVLMGIMGAGTVTLGILIHDRIRIMRRRKRRFGIKRGFSIKRVKGKGYRVISIPHKSA